MPYKVITETHMGVIDQIARTLVSQLQEGAPRWSGKM